MANTVSRFAGIALATIASSSPGHAEIWIGAPLQNAPCPATAVNTSSRTGSSTTACVTSIPCASATLTA